MWLAGSTALIQGQLADASRLLKTALADGLQSDESLMWKCSLGLAWMSMYRGEFAAARTALDEGLKAAQSREFTGGSERVVGPVSRWILGWMDLADGRPAQARDGVTPLTGFIRATPLYGWAGLPMLVLAEAQLALGELDEAAATLDEATSLARSGALTWVLGRVALVRAKLHARKDDLQHAESLAHEAFGLAREAGDQLGWWMRSNCSPGWPRRRTVSRMRFGSGGRLSPVVRGSATASPPTASRTKPQLPGPCAPSVGMSSRAPGPRARNSQWKRRSPTPPAAGASAAARPPVGPA